MTKNQTLCFSGHRRYDAAPEDEVRLFCTLEAALDDGYRTFISGMAPGFDLAAAEAVVRLHSLRTDVRLVAAVPFAGQSRGYTAADLARYEELLAVADEVRVLADRYSHGCYWRRDDWMVEHSGRIICWYDPSRASRAAGRSGSGNGTRYTVRRAVASGLEVVNLFRDPDGTLF